MNHEKEKELFKLAYLNLRTADSIPFPDAVFDEYVRLRDSEGYKLVPVEPTQGMVDKAVCDTPETPSQDYWHSSQPISDDQAIACYKAMTGEETK